MKNMVKNRVPLLCLVAAGFACLSICSAQDKMSSFRRSDELEEIQGQTSEQRFLREPLDQVIELLLLNHSIVDEISLTLSFTHIGKILGEFHIL